MVSKPPPKIASMASQALRNPSTSSVAKSLAASALAQSNTGRQTGGRMEDVASKVLNSSKYSSQTKAFAGSVLSQSNKSR